MTLGFRRSTQSGSKGHPNKHKARSWFSSSSKLGSSNAGDDLAADAVAAARGVDEENRRNNNNTGNGGPYTPRVEYGSPHHNFEERDASWTSQVQVETHYAEMGWSVVEISKDGNCLFRAISDQLYTNELFHKDIRKRLVDFIQQKQELFKPFVEDEEVSEYCSRMREDGEWGGHLELYAAAKLFNIHIVVHTGPVRRLRVENDGDDGGAPPPYRILHLLYREDHYSSLHPKDPEPAIDTTAKRAPGSPQKKTVRFQIPGEEDVRGAEDVKDVQDAKAMMCEEAEVPECGVYLPHQAIFRHGKRRPSGATLFSMVHLPSAKNLLAIPESASLTSSETGSETSSSSSEAGSETSSSSGRVKPTTPAVRAVPVSYPSKTKFRKGRPVASCC